MKLTIQERQVGDVTILELEGRLTLGDEAESLQRRLERLAKAGRNKIILNLEQVNRLDSVGLGTLLGGIKKVRTAGGDIRILRLSQQARDLLDLLGIRFKPDILQVFADERDALASFQPKLS